MKDLAYQRRAIDELADKTVRLLNLGGKRRKIVFEAPTGAGKTVMACQALAAIADTLHDRGNCRYREVAYIWIAPHKLHLQSYEKLKGAFSETRRLSPVMFDELEQSEGIQPGEILFINWESVNKDSNLIVKESESSASLYEITRRTQQEFGLPIVVIIDEEHSFWSKTADKSAAVLGQINPEVEIRISATPKTTNPDEIVRVYRQDVIAAEMIKREVVLNPDIELDFAEEHTLNQSLIKAALGKRDQIAEAYKRLGVNINPLLLIQLPNDTRETMTADDTAIAEQVKEYLRTDCDITPENGLLAVWLANEKSDNLPDLERPDNLARVLLFKEAIALGWDCPRAAVLLIFRKLQSNEFTVQTVGRILRMPQQRHYPNELLNTGYVYTDIAKDKIKIITDADYLHKDVITARRREGLANVSFPSYYSERPNAVRNYLGPDFGRTLYETARDFWQLGDGSRRPTVEEMSRVMREGGDLAHTSDTDDNCRRASLTIRLDVDDANIKIAKDVHFQNDVQLLQAGQMEYARKPSEIDRAFRAYINTKGHQFESKGRTDKIASYLLEMLDYMFGITDIQAMKVVLHEDNIAKFDRLLDNALETYARKRQEGKAWVKAKHELKKYDWEVPEERTYDSEANRIVAEAGNHALQPFVQLNQASAPEREFEQFLEANAQWIDWWYKNGDNGKQHFAIPYDRPDGNALFYIDFVIRMKNGHFYLFDTKKDNIDQFVVAKHNALVKYLADNTTDSTPLSGGIIIRKGSNWLYPRQAIDNLTDTLGWESFYPDKA